MAKRNSDYDSNKPKYEWGDSWTKKDPTQKQRDYIEVLAEQTGIKLHNLDQLTRGGASGLIDELRQSGGGTRMCYLKRDWSEFLA